MTITDIKRQVKQEGRYSIYIDGKFMFGLSDTALLEQKLSVGMELSPEAIARLKKVSADDKSYGLALRYAAMRPRSRWELQFYLRRKQMDESATTRIIERLASFGMVDDLAFARSWVQNRRLLKNISKRRLRLELQQKHVDDSIISQVLEEDEGTDADALRELIRKRRSRYDDPAKLMQFLARQGFGYDDIKSALRAEDESGD